MGNTPLSTLVVSTAVEQHRDLPALTSSVPAMSAYVPPDEIENRYPYQRFIKERQKFIDMVNSTPSLAIQIEKQLEDARESGIPDRTIYERLASTYAQQVGVASDPDTIRLFAVSVGDDLVGLAGLEDLIRDKSVMNITVVWRQGSACRVRIHRVGNQYEDLKIQIASSWTSFKDTTVGRAISMSHKQTNLSMNNPYVEMVIKGYEARFVVSLSADGSQVFASMRLNRVGDPDLDDLLKLGVIPNPDVRDFLKIAMAARCNILFAGPQQSGKTTILRGYINSVPRDEEIMIVEDIPELGIEDSPRHDVVLNFEASPQAPMRVTISRAMRYVVRRIFVGEALDSAVLNWLFASVRLRGSACTLHAESMGKVFEAIVGLSTINTDGFAPVPRDVVLRNVADAVDFIVFMEPEESIEDPTKSFPTVKGVLAIDDQVSSSGLPKSSALWEWDTKSKTLVWGQSGLPDHIARRWSMIGLGLNPVGDRPDVVIQNRSKIPPSLAEVVDEVASMKRSLHEDPSSAFFISDEQR
jgi:Flp pilus assembly CpaF family ATPase